MNISTYRKIILGNNARLVSESLEETVSISVGWFLYDRVYYISEIKKHKRLLFLLNQEFLKEIHKKKSIIIFNILNQIKKLPIDVIRLTIEYI